MATSRKRPRTRQGPKSPTITAVQPVPRPSKPPRTPNVEELEIRPRPRGVRVSAARVGEAVYDEVLGQAPAALPELGMCRRAS